MKQTLIKIILKTLSTTKKTVKSIRKNLQRLERIIWMMWQDRLRKYRRELLSYRMMRLNIRQILRLWRSSSILRNRGSIKAFCINIQVWLSWYIKLIVKNGDVPVLELLLELLVQKSWLWKKRGILLPELKAKNK